MSPLAVDKLTPQSGISDIRNAIGQSIQQCIQEGKTQEQCAAIAYDISRKKTGKALGQEAQ